MTFIKGDKCELRVLEESDDEAKIWTKFVMHSSEHMKFVMTGSQPMRWFDIRDEWKREREKGAVLFGVWAPSEAGSCGECHMAFPSTDLSKHTHHRFIGTCGLYNPYEIYHRWEARFMIVDPEAVGKGVGLEVAKMLTKYGFDKLNAHKIWLGVNADNLVAYKCYLSAGYRVEGTLREDLYVNGKYVDAVRMAVLKDEWRKNESSAS